MKFLRKIQNEEGAVLISTLLLVALLSMVSVALVDKVRAGIWLTQYQEKRLQGFQYLKGAEDLAQIIVHEAWKSTPEKTNVKALFKAQPDKFPIPEGVMEVLLTDGGSCFNLNSLVKVFENGRTNVSKENREIFHSLLGFLSFSEPEKHSLTASLIDWIDSDNTPQNGGAEDSLYMQKDMPYRASSSLIGDITELRSIQNFDEEVYNRISFWTCALPKSEINRLNINSLFPIHAPLLASIFKGKISLQKAQNIIEQKPESGFQSIEEFWGLLQRNQVEITQNEKKYFSLKSNFINLVTKISMEEDQFESSSLFEVLPNGKVVIKSRLLGEQL